MIKVFNFFTVSFFCQTFIFVFTHNDFQCYPEITNAFFTTLMQRQKTHSDDGGFFGTSRDKVTLIVLSTTAI